MPLGLQIKLHPAVTRSRSFHGFGGQQDSTGRSRVGSCRSPERRSRGLSSPRSPAAPPQPPRVAQPQLFRTTVGALCFGLEEYLAWHQAQQCDLTIAINSTKRDSRLGLLYELDKQIRANERNLRRLEFQMSKVDMLREEHTVQARLHAGADNLARALGAPPGTRGSRDARVQAQRSARECFETMAQLEGQMENFLGEFHVKIRGLVGFARLCPKDTYEVSLRHGRQRWKVRGRIGADGEQRWASDGTVLLPLIGEQIVIKVVELKGLATQVALGQVSLEPTELYRKDERQLELSVNPLGTVKLQLLVHWLALEREEPLRRVGSVSGHRRTPSSSSSSSQRFIPVSPCSLGSPCSPCSPSTPSTPDQAFFEEFYPTDDAASSVFSDSLDSPAASPGSPPRPSLLPASPASEPPAPGRLGGPVDTAQKGRGSSGSLTVESALGSFDFLDDSDGERVECADSRG